MTGRGTTAHCIGFGLRRRKRKAEPTCSSHLGKDKPKQGSREGHRTDHTARPARADQLTPTNLPQSAGSPGLGRNWHNYHGMSIPVRVPSWAPKRLARPESPRLLFVSSEHERGPCSRARCHPKGSIAAGSDIAPARDDFRQHQLRIGTRPLAPGEAGAPASPPFTLGPRPEQRRRRHWRTLLHRAGKARVRWASREGSYRPLKLSDERRGLIH
jgi:hypothetical protein